MTRVFNETVDDIIAAFEFDFSQPSDVFSDLVIEVDDKGKIAEYHCHKFILSRRSPQFKSILRATPSGKQGPGSPNDFFLISNRHMALFLNYTFCSDTSGVTRISIIGHTHQSVLKLLKFLYTGRASIEVPTSYRVGALGEAWELYRLAEQYEIESLSTFCETVMRTSIGKPGDKKHNTEGEEEDSSDSPVSRRPSLSVGSPTDR